MQHEVDLDDYDPTDKKVKVIVQMTYAERKSLKLQARKLGMTITSYLIHFALAGGTNLRYCETCGFSRFDLGCPGCDVTDFRPERGINNCGTHAKS